MNLPAATIWVRFTWRFCSCVWDFYIRAKVQTLCFNVFVPSHICARCLFFWAQITKIRYATYQTVVYVLCQIFNHDISGWFCLQKLIILFPPVKYDFNNSVSLNAFASKAATRAVTVGHSSTDLEFFLDRTFRASTSSFSANLKPNSAVPFLPRDSGRGGLPSGLA